MSEWDDDDAAIVRDFQEPPRAPEDVDREKCNVPSEYWSASPKNVTASVKPVLSRYIAKRAEYVPGGVGLYLHGPAGRGKSSAAVKLAMALAGLPRPYRGINEGHRPSVYYTPVSDLRRAIHTRVEHLNWGPIEQHIRLVSFLVLDDLVARDMSDEWFSLLRIIKGRMDTGKPTFVTSILSPVELKAVQPLIWDQLGDNFLHIEVVGPNRRAEPGTQLRKYLIDGSEV